MTLLPTITPSHCPFSSLLTGAVPLGRFMASLVLILVLYNCICFIVDLCLHTTKVALNNKLCSHGALW